MKRIAFVLLVSSLVLVKAFGQNAPYTFKGNSLGMSLDAFKATNNQGQVYINTGTANWRGKSKKELTKAVPTPLCTDQFRGFPDDDDSLNLAPGEVFCNPAPGAINIEARTVAGLPIRRIRYFFYNGALYKIDMAFAALRYPVIKAAFISKYGPPTSRSESDFQNGFGAQWKGENLFWNQGKQLILLYEGGKNGPGQNPLDDAGSSSVVIKDDSLGPAAGASSTKTDF